VSLTTTPTPSEALISSLPRSSMQLHDVRFRPAQQLSLLEPANGLKTTAKVQPALYKLEDLDG
jgi:hypothetical protein